MNRIVALGIFMICLSVNPLLPDSSQDTLPLGPSPDRYDLVKIEANQIYDSRSGNIMDLPALVRGAEAADVIVIGEFHDNFPCHEFQRDFIEALVRKHPRLIVGFEFFQRGDNEALELWRNGKISEEELIRKTGWYKRTSYNFGFTRMIMEVIQKHRIKTIGLNVSRDILHQVSRKGFDSLGDAQKELFPTVDIPNPEHRFLIQSVFGDFAVQVPFWFENVYTAQKCWDVVMAESMKMALDLEEYRGYKGIIIAGSLHVAYGLGIPFRYRSARPDARIMSMVPVMIPLEKPESDEEEHPMKKIFAKTLPPSTVFCRGIADVVFSVPEPPHSHFPELGITCKMIGGDIQVTALKKKSLAEAAGLKKGDIVSAADGIRLETLEQFRRILAEKKWEDIIELQLGRKIKLSKEEKKDP